MAPIIPQKGRLLDYSHGLRIDFALFDQGLNTVFCSDPYESAIAVAPQYRNGVRRGNHAAAVWASSYGA